MSDWRRAALGVLPPRHHQSLLDRLETTLSRLAPYVGAPGGSSQGFEQLLSRELQSAGVGASPGDLQQLVAAISRGGAAGMAVAIAVATSIADGTWVPEAGDEVTVAFASMAARPALVLQQLWTPCGAPPLSASDLGQISRMPPQARAAEVLAALRPRRRPP